MWGGNFLREAWNGAKDLGKKAAEKTMSGMKWVGDKAGKAKDFVVDTAKDIKDYVVEKAGQAKDYVVEKATAAKDYVVNKAVQAKDYVVEKSKQMKDFVVEKAGQLKDFVTETYKKGKKMAVDAVVGAVSAVCDKVESAIKAYNDFKERHYNRNQYQKDLPLFESEVADKPDEWMLEGESPTHNMNGAKGNVSYRGVGPNEGKQVVFDANGIRVDDPANQGTYDFYSPIDNFGKHIAEDVIPWIIWGNSEDDPTNPLSRASAAFIETPVKKGIDWLDEKVADTGELLDELGSSIKEETSEAKKKVGRFLNELEDEIIRQTWPR